MLLVCYIVNDTKLLLKIYISYIEASNFLQNIDCCGIFFFFAQLANVTNHKLITEYVRSVMNCKLFSICCSFTFNYE